VKINPHGNNTKHYVTADGLMPDNLNEKQRRKSQTQIGKERGDCRAHESFIEYVTFKLAASSTRQSERGRERREEELSKRERCKRQEKNRDSQLKWVILRFQNF
jgi:hypothetical protein